MKIDVIQALQLSPEDSARWTSLQALQPRLDSPFLSPQWAKAVATAQADQGDRVKVAVIRDDDGQALAYLPVRVKAGVAMPAGAPMCDYQALVSEHDIAVDPRRLLAALKAQRLDFCHMLADDETLARHGRGQADSWIVDVSAGYEAYATDRKSAGVGVLKDIDKKRRKAEREIGPARYAAMSESRADFDQLIAWKREQLLATGQTDLFKTDWVNRLVEDMFARRDPDFGGGLYTLHLGDELAAVHLHLRGAHTIHGWLIAHNAKFDRYSPGLLLFQDILKGMDGGPHTRLDLGTGDYRFKRELSNARQTVVFGFYGAPSPATFVRSAAWGVRQVAEALPLGRMSALPGKAMRRIDLLRGLH
ncbi:cellulose biosynthesis protein CelD [Caulobacter sp. D4A]|nr:GNAT family N-acetyltransferase [Caulobacter sp. D4A]PXA81287.1 cellulose biosynthesis protein CelD [Caulobacter sp. D4A]